MSHAIYLPEIHNPFENFALEEALFFGESEHQRIMMLWVNSPCVVIGRNQNPWREVALQKLNEDCIPLIRRISGGGTVYHDYGNLNYSFITSDRDYNESEHFSIIISALATLGIHAVLNKRKDLLINNLKNSGNAFYFRGNRRLHHGTLLVDTDHKALWRYLEHERPNFEVKGIASQISEIINMKDMVRSLKIEQVINAILSHYLEVYPETQIYRGGVDDLTKQQSEVFQQAKVKHTTWDWQYGETPKFKYFNKEENHVCR